MVGWVAVMAESESEVAGVVHIHIKDWWLRLVLRLSISQRGSDFIEVREKSGPTLLPQHLDGGALG